MLNELQKFNLYVTQVPLLTIIQVWSCICVAAFITCSYSDIRTRRIPNRITYPCLLGTLLLALLYPPWLLSALSGGGLAMVTFLIPRFLFGTEKAGMGDVKLAAIGGLLVGPGNTIAALTITYVAALIILTPIVLGKRLKRNEPVAFGPFIAFGFIWILITVWSDFTPLMNIFQFDS